MALPLLPTLVVAVILAAASLLCTEPGTLAPDTPTQVSAAVIDVPSLDSIAADTTVAFVPAALAFPSQFPMVVEARVDAPVRRAVPRIAARTTPRRVDPGKVDPGKFDAGKFDAGKAEAAHTDIARAPAAPAPVVVAKGAPNVAEPVPFETASDDDALPALALPFAPAIRALGRAGTFVGAGTAAAGAQASAFGDAVVGLVDHLR